MGLGDRAVKTGLECGDQGQPRKAVAKHPHRLGVGWIVGRSDVGKGLHRFQHVVVNPMHPGQVAGMNRLEADGRHLARVAQNADLGIGELLEAKLDRLAMVGDGPVHLPLTPGRLHDQPSHRTTNALDGPAPAPARPGR